MRAKVSCGSLMGKTRLESDFKKFCFVELNVIQMMDASKRKATASGTDAKKESKADASDFLSLAMFLCF